MNHFKIIWTDRAINSLKGIFDFYKEKSLTAAHKIVDEILKSPLSIHFPEQYQIDLINSKYRRIIVRDYKILYNYKNNIIYIYNVICTKQSPKKHRK